MWYAAFYALLIWDLLIADSRVRSRLFPDRSTCRTRFLRSEDLRRCCQQETAKADEDCQAFISHVAYGQSFGGRIRERCKAGAGSSLPQAAIRESQGKLRVLITSSR